MDVLKNCSELVYFGAKDCICGSFALRRILFPKNTVISEQQKNPRSSSFRPNKEPKMIWKTYSKCLVLGTIIGLSIFLYSQVFTRFSNFLTSYMCPGEEFYWLNQITSIIFWTCWQAPMFPLSRILAFTWYQNIATQTCQDFGISRRVTQTFGEDWAEQILSACVQAVFLFQAYAVLYITSLYEGIIYYLGYCVFIIHLALLYSVYAFEYKWCQKGWSFSKRTAYVELKWPYFVGFGLPLAILTSYFEQYFGSMCFFTIFFPITVITSTVTFNVRHHSFQKPLRAFCFATFISDHVLQHAIEYSIGLFSK